MRNAIALSYEYSTSTVFYSDIQRGSLLAVHFNGSRHREILQSESEALGRLLISHSFL